MSEAIPSALLRRKRVVAAGLLLGVLLGALTMFRVGPSGIGYRAKERWASYTTLFVTQRGFPWGRLGPDVGAGPGTPQSRAPYADPNRLSALASLYAQLATSDLVRQLVLRGGPIDGSIEAAPVLALPTESEALPFVTIAGIADTPGHAAALAGREASALVEYLQGQQAANAIPVGQRVMLEQVNRPGDTKLLQGRKKTLPIVVFLVFAIASVGLAVRLEQGRGKREPSSAPAPVSG